MTIAKKAKVAIVTPKDLNENASGTNVTLKDCTQEVQDAVKDSDIVIYEDESKVRSIIVFNNDLETEPVGAVGTFA